MPPPTAPPYRPTTPPAARPPAVPRRRGTRGPAIALLAFLLAAGTGTVIATTRGGDAGGSTPTTPATTTTTETTTTTVTTTAATAGPAGLVAIDQPGDLAARVAAMFETYFSGINANDPEQALTVVEPTDRMDPTDPADIAAFGKAIATTQDDDVQLGTVTDNGTTVTAELSFRSRQDAGYGPADDPDQTCTRWTMVYTLADSAGGLRIRDVDATHQAC
ncbi:hypothetical protein GCM10010168_45900 [Actinoplanes ianthinogenes]|nr:hypothetical protein GCM10010168_45900 [Actinoplanes ianthinogenes]